MSRVALALMLVIGARIAHAERVDLADRDPELRRALTAALAPWKANVVVVDDREATDARFVVWRENDELVVRDRERGTIERRASHGGALDPIAAAAAALTVKTMLNLPPIDQGGDLPPPITTATSRPQVALELGGGGRVAGDDFGTRGAIAVFLKPTMLGLRIGFAGEIGTSADVDASGFEGTWSDWDVRGIVGWRFELAPWSVEPRVTIGMTRSSLDGLQSSDPRHESATLFTVGAGVVGWRQIAPVRVGLAVDLDWISNTPTYTKPNMGMGMGMPTVFQVPNFTGSIGIVVAIDLDL